MNSSLSKEGLSAKFENKYSLKPIDVVAHLYTTGNISETACMLSISSAATRKAMEIEEVSLTDIKELFFKTPIDESFFSLKESRKIFLDECDEYAIRAVHFGINIRLLNTQLNKKHHYIGTLTSKLGHDVVSLRNLGMLQLQQLIEKSISEYPHTNKLAIAKKIDSDVMKYIRQTLSVKQTASLVSRTEERVSQILKKNKFSIREEKVKSENQVFSLYSEGMSIFELAEKFPPYDEAAIERIIKKLTPKNSNLITQEVRKKIYQDYISPDGGTPKEIAKRYGVSPTGVYYAAASIESDIIDPEYVKEILIELADGGDWKTLKSEHDLNSAQIMIWLRKFPVIQIEQTSDVINSAVMEYANGAHPFEVCSRYGMSDEQFLKYRKQKGYEPQKPISEQLKIEYLKLIDAGQLTSVEVAKAEGVTKTTVYLWRLKYLKDRRKYNFLRHSLVYQQSGLKY